MSESLIKARVYLMHRKKVAFDTPTNADILMGQLCDELEATETKLRELVKELRRTASYNSKHGKPIAYCVQRIEAILDRESNDQAANKLAREQGFDGCNDYYIGRNKPNPTEDN